MRKDFPKSPTSADLAKAKMFPCLLILESWQNDLEMPFQFSTRGTFKKRAIFNTLSRVGPGGLEAFIYSQAGLKKAT